MERICPYLALSDDGRTVADGFDAEHRCHALTPPVPLERARQVQLCLTEAHAGCERFAAARTAWLAASSGLPRVAPDVAFGRTRLILEPEPAWRRGGAPTARFSRQTILIALAAAAVVVLLVLGRAFGILGGAAVASTSPTPTASASTAPSPTAPAPSNSTQGSPSPAPTATPAPSAAPTQRIYTVVANDTLNKIALQFGTTVAAIEAANGLPNDTINVGQKLIIP